MESSIQNLTDAIDKHREIHSTLNHLVDLIQPLPEAKVSQAFLKNFAQDATRYFLGNTSKPDMTSRINLRSRELFTDGNSQVPSWLKNEIMDTMQDTAFAIATHGNKKKIKIASRRSQSSTESTQEQFLKPEEIRIKRMHDTLTQCADKTTADLLHTMVDHLQDLGIINDKVEALSKFTTARNKNNAIDLFQSKIARHLLTLENRKLTGLGQPGQECKRIITELQIHLGIREPEKTSDNIRSHTDKIMSNLYDKLDSFTDKQDPANLAMAQKHLQSMLNYRDFIGSPDKFNKNVKEFGNIVSLLPLTHLQKGIISKNNQALIHNITQFRPTWLGDDFENALSEMKISLQSIYLYHYNLANEPNKANDFANQVCNNTHHLHLDYMSGAIDYKTYQNNVQNFYAHFAGTTGNLLEKMKLRMYFTSLIDTAMNRRPEVEKTYHKVTGPVGDTSQLNPLSPGQKPFFDECRNLIMKHTGIKPSPTQKLTQTDKEEIFNVWQKHIVDKIEHKPQGTEKYGDPRNAEYVRNNGYISPTITLRDRIAVCRELSMFGAALFSEYGIKSRMGYGRVAGNTTGDWSGSHAWIELLDQHNQITGVVDSNYTKKYHPSYQDYEIAINGIKRNSVITPGIHDSSRVVDIVLHHPINGVSQIL